MTISAHHMTWVQSPFKYPQRCAVLPYIPRNHPLGFIDTGQDTASGERVYVSLAALHVMAEGCGYRRPADESKLFAENKRLTARVAELERELAAQGEELAAVHVLKRGGFAASAKTGPKAKAVA